MRVMLFSFFFVLCGFGLPALVNCCSCPIGGASTRGDSLRAGICSGDVYVARVTGATCSCLPIEGEERTIYCQDYQLQGESNQINVELQDRGECYGSVPYAVSINSVHTCSQLSETSGLVIPDQGYSVQELSNTTLPSSRNLTRSAGFCDLPCLVPNGTQFSQDSVDQGCIYNVTITDVFRGNYDVGQAMAVSGPDTTTTCGNPKALLKIDEQYVVGVGSICEAISPWSTLQSYSTNELQTLREFGQDFETRSLTCRAQNFVSSFVLIQIVSTMALVAMTTLFY